MFESSMEYIIRTNPWGSADDKKETKREPEPDVSSLKNPNSGVAWAHSQGMFQATTVAPKNSIPPHLRDIAEKALGR